MLVQANHTCPVNRSLTVDILQKSSTAICDIVNGASGEEEEEEEEVQ